MQAPVFMARIIGPLFVAVGVSMLLNAPIYSAMVLEAMHSPTLIFLTGVLSLPVGIAMLNVYRAWTADWRVIVTILGWLFTIGGVVRIVLPHFVTVLADATFSSSAAVPIVAVIVLLIGGYLSFNAYRPVAK